MCTQDASINERPSDQYMQVQAHWAKWNGKEFAKEAEVFTLQARLTPKQLHVTLPSGLVLRFTRFDRVGRQMTMWRHYYGGNTQQRKYIHVSKAEAATSQAQVASPHGV